MRIPRLLAPLVGALALTSVLTVVVPAAARADTDSLAATAVTDAPCGGGAPTFDDIVGAAATALRTAVPADQAEVFDQRVAEFRGTLAAVRVHRDGLPVHPDTVNERTEFLDDPIVTYLVNGLDAVRTGRIDHTVSVSRLTVNDAIETFILATRIVKIPAQLAASLVPTVGILLKPLVGAAFNGVKTLARGVQDHLAATCAAPNVYPKLVLEETVTERVALPAQITDLANSLTRADGNCTPVAELTMSAVVERTRAYLLANSALPLDHLALNGAADSVQTFLRDNRIAQIALMRRTEELGPLVDAIDHGLLTFLTNFGFDLYEGRALDTVALADVRVEHVFDLATLSLDLTSVLLSVGNAALGWTGVASSVTTPLALAQTLAFAPTTYGTPIVKGVMQSMCAVQ